MDSKTYSPGLHKFVHHLDHLKGIVNGDCIAPLHISVWPTIKCQFNCPYCCCKYDKNKFSELNINEFKDAVDVLVKYGTKALEFSGGGEPLLWKHFCEAVEYVYYQGIKLSLITNGIEIPNIPRYVLEMFSWIRVSLQSLNHAKKIDFKNIPTRVSASYILDKPDKIISDLYDFTKENDIIIRVAMKRPVTKSIENMTKNYVEKFGEPLFFSKKERGRPLGCYMAWVRAAIDWRGNFLPCPSIQLTEESEGTIPDSFPLCHISELEDWLDKNRPHDLGYRCSFCNCGKEHNDFIYNLLSEVEDVDFV